MEDYFGQYAAPQQDPRIAAAKEQVMGNLLRKIQQPAPQQQAPAMQPSQPTMSPEQMQDQYKQMQRMQTFGNVLQASGDKALSPLGRTLARKDPDRWLQNQQRAEQVQKYQNWQMADNARPEDDARFLVKSLNALGDLEEGGSNKSKMPSGWGEKLMYDSNQIRSLDRAVGSLDNAYNQATGQAIGLPGYTGVLEGIGAWMNQNTDKLTTQEMKDAAQYWADLEANVIAPWRHELFGATLTDGEKQAFARLANLTPGMPMAEVEKRLNNLRIARAEGARDRVAITVGNYGRGHVPTLKQLYGNSLNQVGAASYDGRTVGKQKKTEAPAELGFEIEWADDEPSSGPGKPAAKSTLKYSVME